MSIAVHNDDPLRWRVGRREAARFRPRHTRKRVRRPNIVSYSATATAATKKGQPGRDRRQRTVQVLMLCPPLCPTLSLSPTDDEGTEIPREKAVEESRLFKCAYFYFSPHRHFHIPAFPVEARWPPSRNQNHEEIPYTAQRGLPQVAYVPSILSDTQLTHSRAGITSYAARFAHMYTGCPFSLLRTHSGLKWKPSCCLNFTTWVSSIPPPSSPRSKINSP
jgi:hypothetical protein